MEYLREGHEFFVSFKAELDNIDRNQSNKYILKDLEHIFNEIEEEYGLFRLVESQSIN